MRRRPGRPALLLAAGLLAAAPACAPRTGEDHGDPGRGGSFVFPLRADPLTLNFISGSDTWTKTVGRLVCDSLVDHDARMRFVPRLAHSWEWSPDGRVLTFRLRPGVRFHDGAPLTSADVVFTWRRVMDPASRATAWIDAFLPVGGVEAPDPLTIRARYRVPYAPALRAWEVPILPAHLYGGEGFADSPLGRAPVGSGPFRFVAWETGRRIILAANPDWWGGRPGLDRIVFQVIPSQETTLRALLAGEIDYAYLTQTDWEAHGASAAFTRRFQILRWSPLFIYYIAWRGDGSNPFFTDPVVRRALLLALDRPGFVRSVLKGLGRVVSFPVPAVLAGFEAADPDVVPFDPERAAQLLDAAGWRLDAGSGLRTRAGVPFRFTLLTYAGGEDHLKFAQVGQENLRRLGIAMEIERLDWPSLKARLGDGRFEAAMSGFVPNSLDPDDLYPMLHSSQIRGGQNYAAFRDGPVDRLLEEGRETLDPGARREIYRRLDARVREMSPYAYLFLPLRIAAVPRRFQGIEASPINILEHFPGGAGIHDAGPPGDRP